MKIETRNFGEMEISEEELLEFVLPILGFEELRRFAVLFDREIGGAFAWLQSVEDPDICFVMMDPALLFEEYHPTLPLGLRQTLHAADDADLVLRCLVVLPSGEGADPNNATANLKSPLVINPATHMAAQTVLEGNYPLRAKLLQRGEAASC